MMPPRYFLCSFIKLATDMIHQAKKKFILVLDRSFFYFFNCWFQVQFKIEFCVSNKNVSSLLYFRKEAVFILLNFIILSCNIVYDFSFSSFSETKNDYYIAKRTDYLRHSKLRRNTWRRKIEKYFRRSGRPDSNGILSNETNLFQLQKCLLKRPQSKPKANSAEISKAGIACFVLCKCHVLHGLR